MSSLIVEICTISDILPHENADRLEVAQVKGWQCVVPKGRYTVDDLCVFIPPDSILSGELAESLGVTNYLKSLPKDIEGNKPDGGRVSVTRLRGIPSYGLVVSVEGIVPEGLVPFVPGQDVADILGITKYVPPEPSFDGDREREHPSFHKYTGIENIRNFPGVFTEKEFVIYTEKVHGKNVRLGYIRDEVDSVSQMVWMAGSHNVPRKEFLTKSRKIERSGDVRSEFWKCFDGLGIKELMKTLASDEHSVVVFGELHGYGVQDMQYGHAINQKSFAVFDITINGRYLDFFYMHSLCERYGVLTVPMLFDGCVPFEKDRVEELTEGATALCKSEYAGKFKGREGVVIRPVQEAWDKNVGRKILKSVSFEYLNRKGGTDN